MLPKTAQTGGLVCPQISTWQASVDASAERLFGVWLGGQTSELEDSQYGAWDHYGQSLSCPAWDFLPANKDGNRIKVGIVIRSIISARVCVAGPVALDSQSVHMSRLYRGRILPLEAELALYFTVNGRAVCTCMYHIFQGFRLLRVWHSSGDHRRREQDDTLKPQSKGEDRAKHHGDNIREK
jgi:hypothetical protein